MSDRTYRSRSSRILSIVGVVVLVLAANLLYDAIRQRSHQTAVSALTTKQTVYDQIIKRGTIRCGYLSNPPSCMKDPNTDKLSGIFVEAIDAAADKLGLKVEWTEEVGFGSMVEGIKVGRYDMVPCAIWPNAQRSRHVDFSRPLFYSGVCAYVRADDTRFDKDISLINSPNIKIATMDGEMAQVIADTDFPKAQKVQVPQLSEITSMLLNVKDGKADVTFVELYFAAQFLKNNPGSIKNITPETPLRVFPNTVLIPQGEFKLQQMINTSMEELVNVGLVDRLITKYEPVPGTFYRLIKPYHVESK